MAENARMIRRWFEQVWNQGLEEAVDAMCAKDVIGHGQAQHGTDIHGPEHFKQFMRVLRGAFSDIHIEIHDTIEQGDKVVARWTTTMKHTGPFLDVPPTGKQVSVNGISIQRWAGGKIIEGWDGWDQLGLLVQLGAAPQAKFL